MSPMNSWKSMGPVVVSALKLGAVEPRRRLYAGGVSIFKSVQSVFIDHLYYTEVIVSHTVQVVVQLKPFFSSSFFDSYEIFCRFGWGKWGSGAKKEDSVHKKGLTMHVCVL